MSPAERRALLLLLALALLGHVVRRFATRPGAPPGEVELLAGLTPRSPAAQRDSALALARPLMPGERIDADRASAAELARLPRVGLTLAKTIVADRAARGPFGSLQGLDRVPGVGPGLLGVVAPFLSFSRAPAVAASAPEPGPAVAARPPTAPAGPLDLNTATVEELDALPGIGPARARAIVAHRETRGPFASVSALADVKGFGPAAVARLEGLITAR